MKDKTPEQRQAAGMAFLVLGISFITIGTTTTRALLAVAIVFLFLAIVLLASSRPKA